MNSPLILSLLTLLIWSLGGVAGRFCNVEGGGFLYLVFILAAFVYYQSSHYYYKGRLAFPSLKQFFSKQFVISSLGCGFYWLFISEAIQLSDNTSLPFSIQYIWVLANAIFFETIFSGSSKPKLSVIPLLLTVVAFCGVLLLSNTSYLPSEHLHSVMLFSVATGLCYGYYSAYCSTLNEEQLLEFLNLSAISGLLVMGIWTVFNRQNLADISNKQILIAFILGFFIDGVGTYLWTRANRLIREKSMKIYSITIVPLCLPFMAAFLLYLFFDEKNVLTLNFWIGLSMIVFSSYGIKKYLSQSKSN